jgi:hypothetical protein
MSTKSILSFFKQKSQDLLIESSSVDKRTTDICNVELEMVYSDSESTSTPKRGKYQIMSPVEHAEIGKYASQHSTPQTIAHFKSRINLKCTSVRNLKSKYLEELSGGKRKLFESTDSDDSFADITELQPRKRGRPVLLGEELDQKVQTLINELRNTAGNINSRIVRALGKGVVKAKDRTLLVENDGSIEIT